MALDLVANNPDEANIWITGLRCLLDSDLSKFIYEILNIDIMQKLIVIVLLKLYTLEGIMRIFIYKEDQKLEWIFYEDKICVRSLKWIPVTDECFVHHCDSVQIPIREGILQHM